METRWEGLTIQLLRLPGRGEAVKATAAQAAIRGLRHPGVFWTCRPWRSAYITVDSLLPHHGYRAWLAPCEVSEIGSRSVRSYRRSRWERTRSRNRVDDRRVARWHPPPQRPHQRRALLHRRRALLRRCRAVRRARARLGRALPRLLRALQLRLPPLLSRRSQRLPPCRAFRRHPPPRRRPASRRSPLPSRLRRATRSCICSRTTRMRRSSCGATWTSTPGPPPAPRRAIG
jgi:hypothetical protein